MALTVRSTTIKATGTVYRLSYVVLCEMDDEGRAHT